MHGSPTTPRRSLAPASSRTSRALEAKLDALRQDPTARNALAARVRSPRSGHKDLLRRVPPPRPWSAVAPELQAWIGEQSSVEATSGKERRKAREERMLARVVLKQRGNKGGVAE